VGTSSDDTMRSIGRVLLSAGLALGLTACTRGTPSGPASTDSASTAPTDTFTVGPVGKPNRGSVHDGRFVTSVQLDGGVFRANGFIGTKHAVLVVEIWPANASASPLLPSEERTPG